MKNLKLKRHGEKLKGVKVNKMKYIEIQNKLISIEDIEIFEKNEKEQKIYYKYSIESLYHSIDYENVKDNINEEKTELEKDYERIKKELIPEKTETDEQNHIKQLENQIEMYKITLNNISSDVSKYKQNLRNIVNSKEFSHKKIQKLKEVI